MLSREPETSWCSCDGAHFTAVTQPVWEVKDSSTSDPSGEGRRGEEVFRAMKRKSEAKCSRGGGGNKTLPLKQLERRGQRLEPSGTFGARVPQSDVSVGAA